MNTLILSDIHLGSKHCQTSHLLQLLDQEPFDRLILNGDTLHSLNLRKFRDDHWRLLTQLRTIGQTRELILIRGNHDHDWHTDRHRQEVPAVLVNGHSNGFVPGNGYQDKPEPPNFRSLDVLPALLGVEMREDYRLEVGGQPYLVTHGDRFDPALESELPRNLAGWCYHLTRKVNKKFAKWLKKRSARWGGVLNHIRQQAVEHACQLDCTGVLIGHTHHADDVQVGGIHYVNSGCWTEPPFTYVTVADSGLQLHQIHD